MNKKYLVSEPYAIRRRRRAKQLPSLDASKRIDIETHWSVSKKQSLKKQFSNVRPNDDDDDDTDDEISNFNWSGHSNFNWPGHSPGQLKFEIWKLKFGIWNLKISVSYTLKPGSMKGISETKYFLSSNIGKNI